MKQLLGIAVFVLLTTISCSKTTNNTVTNGCNCSGENQCATIVKVAAHCNNYGIEVNGQQYPSSNIPAQFQVEGIKVCVQYNLFDDQRLCACCGGTWADIINMSSSSN